MPEDFLNFVMGGALCALGGVIGFLVRKRWPNNHVVTVLSDTAIRADDLDEAQALEAKERAEKLLADKSADLDYARAQAELAQSMAQLAAIKKLREKGR